MNRGLSVAGTCILGVVALIGIGPASGQEPKKAPKPPAGPAPVVPPRQGTSETIGSSTARPRRLGGTWIVLVGQGWRDRRQEHRAGAGEHLPADQGEIHRLPAHRHGQAGRVGDALGHRLLGPTRPRAGRPIHLRRPPRDVPLGLGHVRPLRPERPAGRCRPGQEGRQAARLERPGDPRPGQPRPGRRQRHPGHRLARPASPTASRKGRSASSSIPTRSRRRSSSRTWSWRRSPRKTGSITVK